MAPGPPPRDSFARRRRNAPAAGDWVDLPPLERPVLPTLPRRTRAEGAWSLRVRRMWDAWRQDPATGRYTPSDVAYAVETAYLAEDYQQTRKVSLPAEIRLRMDGLGLTPKGKQGLRWRVTDGGEVVAHPTAARTSGRMEAMKRRAAIDPALADSPRRRLEES